MISLTRRTLSASASIMTSSVFTRALSFATFLILIRALTVSQYGGLVLLFTAAIPVNVLSSWGLEDTVVADVSRAFGERNLGQARALLFQYLGIKTVVTALLLVGGVFLGSVLVRWFGSDVMTVYWMLAFFIAANTIRGYSAMVFQIGQRFSASAWSEVVESLVRLSVIVFFFLTHSLNISHALLAYAIGKTVAVVIFLPVLWQPLRNLFRVASDRMGGLWSVIRAHGKWELLRTGVGQISSNLDPWSVGLFRGRLDVGFLSVTQNVVSSAFQLFPLGRIINPIVAERAQDPVFAEKIAAKATKYGLLFYFVLAIALAVVAYPVILVFLPKYLPSYFYMLGSLPRTLLIPIGMSQTALLFALRGQKQNFWASNIGLVSSFTLLPLFTWLFGVWGALLEVFLSTLGMYIAREVSLRRVYGVRVIRLREWLTMDDYDRWLLRKVREYVVVKILRRPAA